MTSSFPQANMSALTPARLINNIFNTRIAPLSLAGSWVRLTRSLALTSLCPVCPDIRPLPFPLLLCQDNVGLLLEAPYSKPSAKKILLTIDLTTAVAREALALEGCSVVVAYHPAIFSGLKSISPSPSIKSIFRREGAD